MPPDQSDEDRREIIGRLQHRYQEAETRRLKAEHDAAIARVDKSNLDGALRRAECVFPDGDPCPECWIMHGKRSEMTPIPHPDPKHYDQWRCRECGHIRDREY
jgi:hypothetical protein